MNGSPAPPRRRRIVWIVAGTLLALLLLRALLRADPPPQLLTAAVTRGDLERTVVATGSVEASELVSVGAQASGQVKSLKVALGDRVKAGQLIAEIDSTNQLNALRSAQAALANVRAQRAAQQATLVQAELAFRRQQTMLAEDATSRADFESARATLDASRAQVESLDAQIEQSRTSADTARANLGYTRIVAPIAGTVVAVVATEGQTVNAVQSSPTIVKIAQLDTITVKAEISEADVIHVKPGQAAYFTILGDPERRFPGRLRSIEPAPESIAENDSPTDSGVGSDEAVYYNGLFDVANADGTLRISMTAQVNIVLETAKNTLLVPSAALGERQANGMHTVQVLDGRGRPVSRAVRVGVNNQVNAQVLSGLAPGEQVVVGAAASAPEPSRAPGPFAPRG